MLARPCAGAALLTVAVQVALVSSVTKDPPIQLKINKLKMFKNISDEDLMVDPSTFIHEHFENKSALRYKPVYHEALDEDVNNSTLDLMKQAIYGTQMRLRDLDGVLEKYRENVAMRMAFLFGRLDQLVIDIRRIYTLALRTRRYGKPGRRRVIQHIVMYEWVTRKHADILYLVEYVIEVHTAAMAVFAEEEDEDFITFDR